MARAFRNLRVDPVVAFKFGLSWRDALYIDVGVTFGLTHRSATSQMVSDAISYIYKMARVPIILNLNVEAWEKVFSAYPDKHLLQYIKFGFPLSISHPNRLTNNRAVNHHSAIQYPDAIVKYIAKEEGFGTILGPASQIHTLIIIAPPPPHQTQRY